MVAHPKPFQSPARLVIHDLARQNGHNDFADDVRRGLSSTPKHLFPKYLYDDLGSQLFEAICRVDEYYLTRAESQILSRYADEIVASLPGCRTLIELGSGSAEKTRKVIEALLRLQSELCFIPVDISASALEQSCRVLLDAYPRLRIRAYAADYFDGLAALQPLGPDPVLLLFLGSNIGNFSRRDRVTFLRAIRSVLRPGDALLLGADLRKERAKLEAAYNDPLGVTRAFILNELSRINREMGGNFNLRGFDLKSIYDEEAGTVNVYLESRQPQSVSIEALQLSITLAAGERIHVENAHKFNLDELSEIANQTGFSLRRTWLDDQEQFSSNLFVAADFPKLSEEG